MEMVGVRWSGQRRRVRPLESVWVEMSRCVDFLVESEVSFLSESFSSGSMVVVVRREWSRRYVWQTRWMSAWVIWSMRWR